MVGCIAGGGEPQQRFDGGIRCNPGFRDIADVEAFQGFDAFRRVVPHTLEKDNTHRLAS